MSGDTMISAMENGKSVATKIRGARKRELAFSQERCTGCGMCIEACPNYVIQLGPIGAIAKGVVDAPYLTFTEDCRLCGICTRVCMFDALSLYVDDIKEEYDALGSIDVDVEGCIFCKLCEKVCPRGDAIVVNRVMPSMASVMDGEFSVDSVKCIYCGICQDICPAEALIVERGELSGRQRTDTKDTPARFERTELNENKCILCGICERACPVDAIKVSQMKRDDKIPFTGDTVAYNNICSWCGWCEEICPTNVIEVQKPFTGEIEIDQDVCQGCGTCIQICPCDALLFPYTEYINMEEFYEPGTGWKKPIKPRVAPVAEKLEVNKDRCIFCGACTNACPVSAIKVTRDKVKMETLPKVTKKILDKMIQKQKHRKAKIDVVKEVA